ncbi:hypothetical protein [Paenibacillus sp. J2TS4]|uniref:hypothetical protein n=1 Tax=Paenibacillus sp. J2TS4 TaxID=2807194 RepID=UPI001B04346A|nr:hypothetical protein [Paenibacillus sp. J2TS4]GIP35680.1 hypothetical protein J2TS4_48900 [Paenibacillus sp. J2TS4]
MARFRYEIELDGSLFSITFSQRRGNGNAAITGTLFDGNITECSSKCIQLDTGAAGSDIRITTNNIFAGAGAPVENSANVTKWGTPEIVKKGAFSGWSTQPPAGAGGGTWTKGSVLWNAQPGSGAPAGWMCIDDVVQPGVWEAFGIIGESKLILKSPNGTRYQITVNDSGQLSVAPV